MSTCIVKGKEGLFFSYFCKFYSSAHPYARVLSHLCNTKRIRNLVKSNRVIIGMTVSNYDCLMDSACIQLPLMLISSLSILYSHYDSPFGRVNVQAIIKIVPSLEYCHTNIINQFVINHSRIWWKYTTVA